MRQSDLEMNPVWQTDFVIAHTRVLDCSFRKWTGRDLLPGVSDPVKLAQKVFEAPFVLVSHGTEADPVLNYGNASALALWEMSWEELTRTPSRLTAEAPNREERARLLEAVTARGFIDDYSGVRISNGGRKRTNPVARRPCLTAGNSFERCKFLRGRVRGRFMEWSSVEPVARQAGKQRQHHNSMPVAMPAAATAAAIAFAGRLAAAGAGGGKRGKFLGQFLRAAMRAFRALPVAGADEDFAVALTLFAMKLVNRHEWKITRLRKMFKRHRRGRK